MQHKFNLIGINEHCAVLACAECSREFGFTALDSFGVIASELAEHECKFSEAAQVKLQPTIIMDVHAAPDYGVFFLGAELSTYDNQI